MKKSTDFSINYCSAPPSESLHFWSFEPESNVELAISEYNVAHCAASSIPLRNSGRMEALIEAQVELYGRIARTYDSLRKSGSTKLTKALISTILRLLDTK